METDDHILSEFLDEGGEILARLEGELDVLERRPHHTAVLSAVLRRFHTLKSGAALVDAVPITTLCHKAEALAMALRDAGLAPEAQVIAVFGEVVAQLRVMFRALRAGREPLPAPDDVLARLLAHTDALRPLHTVFDMSEIFDVTAGQQFADVEAHNDPLADILDDDSLMKRVVEDMLAVAMADPDHDPRDVTRIEAPLAPPDADADAARGAQRGSVDDSAADTHKASVPDETTQRDCAQVRVNAATLDHALEQVAVLIGIARVLAPLAANDARLAAPLARLSAATGVLHAAISEARTQTLENLFARLARGATTLGARLDKQVMVDATGAATRLDKTLIEALAAPLEQLVHNAIEHGIEPAALRAELGKPTTGHIEISARQSAGLLELCIVDDGAGMDVTGLRESALQRGLLAPHEAATLDPRACLALALLPGVSRGVGAHGCSGHGVGLDTVARVVEQRGGHLALESEAGAGTRICLRLPLHGAAQPVFVLDVAGQRCLLPAVSVREISALDPAQVRTVAGLTTARIGERTIALLELEAMFGQRTTSAAKRAAELVRITFGERELGLPVDAISGPEDVTVKPLGALMQQVRGFAGAATLGDGSLALVLDLPGLIEIHAAS